MGAGRRSCKGRVQSRISLREPGQGRQCGYPDLVVDAGVERNHRAPASCAGSWAMGTTNGASISYQAWISTLTALTWLTERYPRLYAAFARTPARAHIGPDMLDRGVKSAAEGPVVPSRRREGGRLGGFARAGGLSEGRGCDGSAGPRRSPRGRAPNWSGCSSIRRSTPPGPRRSRPTCSRPTAFRSTRAAAAGSTPITGPASGWPMRCSTSTAAAGRARLRRSLEAWVIGALGVFKVTGERRRAGSASGWAARPGPRRARTRSPPSVSACAAG